MCENQFFGLEKASCYTGAQVTPNGAFKIDMRVDAMYLSQYYMCGTFKIYNLTSQHDLIHTYFECEILPNNPNPNPESELKHWRSFIEWKNEYSDNYNVYENRYLFLKIKELFVLPDPTVRTIPGASIDGLYYCVYDKHRDNFKGFYYYEHNGIQPSQPIILRRVTKKQSGMGEFC